MSETRRSPAVKIGILLGVVGLLGAGFIALAATGVIGAETRLIRVADKPIWTDADALLGSCEVAGGATECEIENGQICELGVDGGSTCRPSDWVPGMRAETALGVSSTWVASRLGWAPSTTALDGGCLVGGAPGESVGSYAMGAYMEYRIERTRLIGPGERSETLHAFNPVGHACGDPHADHDHDDDEDH